MEGVSLFRGPELARLFVMFLAVMGVITAARSVRLLWRLSQASVIATRGLMPVMLLGTLVGTVVNIYPAWELAGPTVTGAAAAYTVGNVILNRLAAGLLLCAAIWAVSTFFQAWLYRRMASWRYFPATTRDIL